MTLTSNPERGCVECESLNREACFLQDQFECNTIITVFVEEGMRGNKDLNLHHLCELFGSNVAWTYGLLNILKFCLILIS